MTTPIEARIAKPYIDRKTYLTGTPEQRNEYLRGMVSTLERKYPEMDPGAKNMFRVFLTELIPIVSPSGGEQDTREHLTQWSVEHPAREQMTHDVDNAGNLLVTIAATPGYEKKPGVMIQTHMDINCNPTAAQNPEISPEIHPVYPVFKEDMTQIGTEGTTLGADDRLGVAAAIALAEEILNNPNVPHGKIGLLFTTDEEVGLTGAQGFSFSKELLKGYNYYLNLDNEDSHEAVVGAAGGKNLDIRLPLTRDINAQDRTYMTIDLHGLIGGHSGADIHFGHLNAIKVLTQVLNASSESLEDIRIVSINSGTTDSAIPQRGHAVIAIKPGQEKLLEDVIAKTRESILNDDKKNKNELQQSGIVKEKEKKKGKLNPENPVIEVHTTTGAELELFPLDKASSQSVLSLLSDLPTGPLDIDTVYNIIKTSTNMGILEILTQEEQDFLRVYTLTRSSSEEDMTATNDVIKQLAHMHGAAVVDGEKSFATWEPNFSDPLLEIAKQTHKDTTDKDLEVNVIHAGLESHTIYLKIKEILGDEMPEDFHILSVGPSLDGPHSENEYVDILEAAEFFPALRGLVYTLFQQQGEERLSGRRS